jgi:hypothetical protein
MSLLSVLLQSLISSVSSRSYTLHMTTTSLASSEFFLDCSWEWLSESILWQVLSSEDLHTPASSHFLSMILRSLVPITAWSFVSSDDCPCNFTYTIIFCVPVSLTKMPLVFLFLLVNMRWDYWCVDWSVGGWGSISPLECLGFSDPGCVYMVIWSYVQLCQEVAWHLDSSE